MGLLSSWWWPQSVCVCTQVPTCVSVMCLSVPPNQELCTKKNHFLWWRIALCRRAMMVKTSTTKFVECARACQGAINTSFVLCNQFVALKTFQGSQSLHWFSNQFYHCFHLLLAFPHCHFVKEKETKGVLSWRKVPVVWSCSLVVSLQLCNFPLAPPNHMQPNP